MHCEECQTVAIGRARGWIAVLLDLPDAADPPEVVTFCPQCAESEFSESPGRRFVNPSPS
jgi:hypothetical protein